MMEFNFYGRKKGRNKKPLLQNNTSFIENFNNLQHKYKQFRLEIGCGYGEHVMSIAQQKPQVLFIASEVFEPGINNMVKLQQNNNIQNVIIFADDVRFLLKQLLTNLNMLNKIEQIYIMYPDPWPKKSHNRRRIINNNTLSVFYNLLTTSGKIKIATDHLDYAKWIIECFEQGCAMDPSYPLTPYCPMLKYAYKQNLYEKAISGLKTLDWPKTRYEEKAQNSLSHYFIYHRV